MSADYRDSRPALNRAPVQRRSAPRLPNRRRHIVGAMSFFAAAMSMPILAVQAFGDRSDALNTGAIQITEPAIDKFAPHLGDETANLPDLLANEFALGDNPTEQFDALGNPILAAPSSAGTLAMAGGPPTTNTSPALIIPPQTETSRLAPLDPSLTRSSQYGPIPGPNQAGQTPLNQYKRSAPSPSLKKPVAIIVGGLGINRRLTQRAIDELPVNVTLSFAAQSQDLQGWINRAREAGHEVLLEIPMEGVSDDPAALQASRAIQSSAKPADIVRDLQFHLARAQGYAGVINYQGQAIFTRSDVSAPILDQISQSGLALFTDGSFETPSLPALAATVNLPLSIGFGVIDPEPEAAVIQTQLSDLSAAALKDTAPVGVGFVFPQTLDTLKGWTATLSNQGLVLVPATATLELSR